MIRKVLKIILIFKSPGEAHENSCKRKIKYLQIWEKNVFAFAVDISPTAYLLYKLLIESLFINSLIFQVIAVILAACYYLLNKQENVDNQTK
jgi:hypothetical protein